MKNVTLLLLFSAILFSSCTEQTAEEVVKIGYIAPLSGENAKTMKLSLNGVEYTVQRCNDDGGLQAGETKRKVELVIRDNEDKIEKSVAIAHELINQEKVAAIVGLPLSRNAIPVARVTHEAGVPLITSSATHPDVTMDKPCVFRISFTDDFQGELLAHFVFDDLGKRRAAILYDIASVYNKTISDFFSETFSKLGGEIAIAETYTTGTVNFMPHIKRIAAENPEVVFLPNYNPDLRLQIPVLKEYVPDAVILGSDSMSTPNREDMLLYDGAFFSTHFSAKDPSEQVQSFVARYEAEYGDEPSPLIALTCDALNLLFSAANEMKSVDSADICKGLNEIKEFDGLTGKMRFDEQGDPQKSAVILQYRDGEAAFYKTIQP